MEQKMSAAKAIAAAITGGVGATAALPVLPDGTPWYGYIILYAVAIGLPALVVYWTPNKPV